MTKYTKVTLESGIPGGGESWTYLIADGKFLAAAHKSEKENMKKIRAMHASLTKTL